MLLDFTVENFRSIAQPVSLNLTAGSRRSHSERLSLLKERYNLRVCPVAAIFGANASGKSTLVQALNVLQKLVTFTPRDGERLDYQPFKLGGAFQGSPTRFELTFALNGFIYEYVIAYKEDAIQFEQLSYMLTTGEKTLFTRADGEISLHGLFASMGAEEQNALVRLTGLLPDYQPLAHFFSVFKLERLGVKEEQLTHLRSVRKWLGQMLVVTRDIIESPLSIALPGEYWKQHISQIDAGIVGVKETDIDANTLKLPESINAEGRYDYVDDSGRYVVTHDGEKISARRIELEHSGVEGATTLSWQQESDGTQSAAQLLDLLSVLTKSGEGLLVIDELDRSFHTELSRALIDGFLSTCSSDSRSQLIFTTHDLLLMDRNRLRADEMWIVEKTCTGSTELTALSEFKGISNDKDIRKSYLQGRFGGVPDLTAIDFAVATSDAEE